MAAPRPATVRPQGWWYLVPAALAVAAVVLCTMAVVRGFGDARDAALDANAAAPGIDQTLTITDPGGYTIAYSGPILVRSEPQQEQLAEDLGLSIEPADGGAPLELRPYEGLNDLEQEGQQYVPLLTVRFEEAGDYVLRSSTAPGVDRDRSALVVLESPFRKLRSGAERAVVILVVGLALAVLVTVILARTRGRAKAVVRAQMPPPAPWPRPVPWGGPPPGGWRSPPPGTWPGPAGPTGWSAPSGPGGWADPGAGARGWSAPGAPGDAGGSDPAAGGRSGPGGPGTSGPGGDAGWSGPGGPGAGGPGGPDAGGPGGRGESSLPGGPEGAPR